MKSNIFKILTVIVSIAGVIGGIVAGFMMQTMNINTLNREFNIGLMLSCWIGTAIIAFVFYGFYSVLALLEKIDTNGNKLLFTQKNAEQKADKSSWKCPSCGRINQNYVGTCGCGVNKPEN